MRLDKFLKVSRLIKRRTVANEACDNGRVSVNGRVVKASYDVKVGDRLEIALGGRTLAVEVLQVAETVRKDDAAAMYREVQPWSVQLWFWKEGPSGEFFQPASWTF